MSRVRLKSIYPVLIYMLMIVLVSIIAWIGNLYEMPISYTESDTLLRNILQIDGLRFLLRETPYIIYDAPIGNALLLLFALGLGKRSGLFGVIATDRWRDLSYKYRASLLLSLLSVILLLALIIVGLFGNEPFLLSLDGTLHHSPLVDGAFLLLSVMIVVPSLLYGFATGIFHDFDDCIDAMVHFIKVAPTYILTLYISALLFVVIDYTQIDKFLSVGENMMRVAKLLLYWSPLPYLMIVGKKRTL